MTFEEWVIQQIGNSFQKASDRSKCRCQDTVLLSERRACMEDSRMIDWAHLGRTDAYKAMSLLLEEQYEGSWWMIWHAPCCDTIWNPLRRWMALYFTLFTETQIGLRRFFGPSFPILFPRPPRPIPPPPRTKGIYKL